MPLTPPRISYIERQDCNENKLLSIEGKSATRESTTDAKIVKFLIVNLVKYVVICNYV